MFENQEEEKYLSLHYLKATFVLNPNSVKIFWFVAKKSEVETYSSCLESIQKCFMGNRM